MARQQRQRWRGARGILVWTDSEAELLLNVTPECKVNRMQENAV